MKLLLDEHIAREVAVPLSRKFPGFKVLSIYETPGKGLPDPPLLEALDLEGGTLVTRDVNTIPEFARARLAAGLTHGGILYVDSKRLRQSDVRGLIRRLAVFLEKNRFADWSWSRGLALRSSFFRRRQRRKLPRQP